MTQNIRDFIPPACHVVALGEPTHQEPAFQLIRNQLFAQLADLGFRSFVLETDRVAALAVDDYVRDGVGTLDTALSEGFSHGWGEQEGNRRLLAWMREYNRQRPPEDQLSFHGSDAPTETMSAPSPRRYLEYARDYLQFDADLTSLLGEDELWSREAAIMNPADSLGATPEAERARVIAEGMLIALERRGTDPVGPARAEWHRARTHLTAGLDLLRYHRQAARDLELNERISLLATTRDAIMARNLLDIRAVEITRGPTMLSAHNYHLRRNSGTMRVAGLVLDWLGAGALIGALLGEQYTFIAGSLGRSDTLDLPEPTPDTYEGLLRTQLHTWGLTPADTITSGRTRTDTVPEKGYFPLDSKILATADTVLFIGDGVPASPTEPSHSLATSDT
ncbi:erythromycin esterase [Nocardia tenerifensis]|uniref:Erythromycin esterase n=1 Tax=Nocardia tenerifensis TaxID=228006 RepID=A0A318JP45_9NOCA|nr:erythromycin esterase family protein [Nocardia tenerifensis]PXX57377.1 erythromycin esterase [Nocardia tenerifensis]